MLYLGLSRNIHKFAVCEHVTNEIHRIMDVFLKHFNIQNQAQNLKYSFVSAKSDARLA